MYLYKDKMIYKEKRCNGTAGAVGKPPPPFPLGHHH